MFIKKIYIYLFIGICGLLIIFLIYLLQNTRTTTVNNPNGVKLVNNENTNIEFPGTDTSSVDQNTMDSDSSAENDPPEETARKFYTWYVNHPSPIKSGDYKKRTDITADFKNTIGIFDERGINPGYDHVFCAQTSQVKNFKFETPMFNYEKTLALVMFKDEKNGNYLFQVKLQKTDDKWIVDDIWCPY